MATKVKLIETGAVTGNIIPDGGIATGKLADDAVTTVKITDANITHAKLHTSMNLTGKTVTVATASGSTNTTAAASTAFVQQELTTLIGGAPSTLNDLNELAAAINDDANYNSTLTTALATKATIASPRFTGSVGIGQNSPTSPNDATDFLHIGSASNQDTSIVLQDAVETWEIYQNDDLSFLFDTTNVMTLQRLTGNVGIGTSTPAAKLNVYTDAGRDFRVDHGTANRTILSTDRGMIVKAGGGYSLELDTGSDTGSILFKDNGVTHSQFNASGNLALGTTTHLTTGGAAKLSVAGILSIGVSNADMSYIRRQSAGNYAWQTYDNNNTGSIQLQPYGGNVGIGTSNPQDTLHVVTDSATTNDTVDVVRIEATSSGTPVAGFGPAIEFRAERGNASADSVGRLGFVADNITASRVDGAFVAETAIDGAFTERLRISSNGKVGIGTVSPSAALSILDDDLTTTGQGLGGWRVHRPGASSQYGYGEYSYGGGGLILGSFYSGGGSSVFGTYEFKQHSSDAVQTSLFIGSTGNVGIGNTSPSHPLTIGTGTIAAPHSGTPNMVLIGGLTAGLTISNTSNSGTGSIFFGDAANSTVGQIRYNHNTGDMAFTAEDDFTFAGGNVGIGETSPGQKLQVNGNIRADGHYYVGGSIVINSSRALQNISSCSIASSINVGSSGAGSVGAFRGDNYNQVNIAHTGNTSWGMLLTNSNSTSNGGYHYSSSGSHNSIAIVNVNNDALHFGTNNNARMIIDHGGDVGIGTSSPGGSKLNVTASSTALAGEFLNSGTSGYGLRVTTHSTGAQYGFAVDSYGGGYSRDFTVGADGNVNVLTGNLVIGTAGKGIDFSATGNATGMSNELLDDYEEGTWTPALIAHAGTDPTITESNSGYYTKVGRLVTLIGELNVSAISGVTSGFINIANIPFTAWVGAGLYPVGNQTCSSFNWANPGNVTCTMYSSTRIGFLTSNNNAGWGWESFAVFSGNETMRFEITYYT